MPRCEALRTRRSGFPIAAILLYESLGNVSICAGHHCGLHSFGHNWPAAAAREVFKPYWETYRLLVVGLQSFRGWKNLRHNDNTFNISQTSLQRTHTTYLQHIPAFPRGFCFTMLQNISPAFIVNSSIHFFQSARTFHQEM